LEIHGKPTFVVPDVASTIFRAILHDPARYPEPDNFKPERFLNTDGTLLDDPIIMSAFGFGKRFCPGKHFADATLFIVVASLLSVFNIEKPKGARGQPFEYTYRGTVIRLADQHLPV
jgi:cytochrome P450